MRHDKLDSDAAPSASPTPRVDPKWQKKQERTFSHASVGFAISTTAFLLMLILAAFTGIEVIFDVGIAIVFLVWLPCLAIAAFTAKYYDPWGIAEQSRKNR